MEAQSRVITLEAELVAVSCRKVTSVATETEVTLVDNYESISSPPGFRPFMSMDSSKSASETNDSSQLREHTELQRKHKAARLIIIDLVRKNSALNNELIVCKRELAVSASKLVALTEELDSERRLRAEDLEEHKNEIQSLHNQISDLYDNKDCCIELTNEINRLRESEERSKRDHNQLLKKLDKVCRNY